MIHPSAIVSPKAELDSEIEIGPYSIIGDKVKIGKNTRIGPHVVLEGPTEIGQNCQIFPFASIGSIPQDLKFKGEESQVIIGSGNIIREYVTINRGTAPGGGKTVLGDGNFLMVYSHVAHDCKIGNQVIIANAAQLAGHIEIEDHAIIGGIVGVHQFVRIGRYSNIGACSAVSRDVPPYAMAAGNHAVLHGLNTVGLKRHNFSEEAVSNIKKAYQIIFRSGLLLKTALEKAESEIPGSPEVMNMITFIGESERGVIR
jgi:UDP-N-acetylglucosamine acyltransferase